MGATGAMMAVTLVSSSIEADGQRFMGRAQQKMARINARRAELQAEDVIKRGGKEALAYGQKVEQFAGSQKAAQAASGVEVGYGTAGQVVDQTYEMGTEDVERIKMNAFREAMGYKQQASDYIGQGNLAKATGKAQANQTLVTGGLRAMSMGVSAYGASKAGGSSESSTPKSTADTRFGSRRSPGGF